MSQQGNAMSTISPAYLAEQQLLHKNPGYGIASVHVAPFVARVIKRMEVRSLSDYGAGKCRLQLALRELGIDIDYRPYDPAYPEYGAPQPADLVTCIDVLEHVEPECLQAVLHDLAQIIVRLGLFTINTGPAYKFLSDGRNAHLIQQPLSWWLDALSMHFVIQHVQSLSMDGSELLMLVVPRATSASHAER
jgi:hypothetical protein